MSGESLLSSRLILSRNFRTWEYCNYDPDCADRCHRSCWGAVWVDLLTIECRGKDSMFKALALDSTYEEIRAKHCLFPCRVTSREQEDLDHLAIKTIVENLQQSVLGSQV